MNIQGDSWWAYLKEWDVLEIFFANFFANGLGYECCHDFVIRMVWFR